MINQWKINGTNAGALGLRVASLRHGVPWEDEATLEAVGSYNAAHAFAYGDTVTIKHPDGTTVLVGKVYGLPREAGGTEAARIYRVRGLWAELEKTVYCQSAGFASADGSGNPVIDVDWTSVVWIGGDTATMFAAIISFAASAGVSIASGTVPTGYSVPHQEFRDISVAEALQRVLPRHPEAVPWIDYGAATPTLHLTPAVDLTAYPLAMGSAPIASLEINPRNDTVPVRVVIVWTRANKYPGGLMFAERRIEISDAAGDRVYNPDEMPTGETLTGPGVLRYTLDVAPGETSAPLHEQDLRTRTLPTAAASATNKKKFWIKNLPWLQALIEAGEIADTDIEIKNHAIAVVPVPTDDDADPDGDVVEDWDTDIAKYPRQLVEGSAEAWLMSQGLLFAPVNATAKIRLTTPASKPRLAKHFGPLGTEEVEADITVTGTDATTKRYTGLPGFTAPEAWPSAGLAQRLWANVSTLRHDGALTLKSDAPPRVPGGTRLTITGGPAEWATLNAPIWSRDYAPDNGTVTLRFGPAGNLTINDYLEMLRAFRQRPSVSAHYAERDAGKLGGSNGQPGSNSSYRHAAQVPNAAARANRHGFELEAVNRDGTLYARIWPGTLWHKGTKLTLAGDVPENNYSSAIPTLGGDALSTVRETTAGHTFYVVWNTTADGALTGTPTVETSPPTAQNHDPDSGTPGTYFVEIGTVSGAGAITQKLHGDIWWNGVAISVDPGSGSGDSGSGGRFTEIYVVTSIDSVECTCDCNCDGSGEGESGESGSGGCSCNVTVCYSVRGLRVPEAWLTGDPIQFCING